MRKVLNKVFDSYIAAVAFFTATLLYCCAPLMPAVDMFINVLLVWIAGCMLYDFIRTRQPFSRDNIPELLFTIWVPICALVGGMNMIDIKVSIYVLIQTVFLCNIFRNRDLPVSFDRLVTFICSLGLVVDIISLVLYFSSFCQVYKNNVVDTFLLMGKHPNGSLWGMLCNSNWMSFFALLVFGLALYRISQKPRRRAFYIVDAVLAFCVLIFSNSRGSLLGVYIFALALIFLRTFSCNKFSWRNVGKFLLSTVLAFVILFASTFVLKQVRTLTFYGISLISQSDGLGGNIDLKDFKQERDEAEKAGSNSARIALWTLGGSVVKDHPIFGVGYHNIKEEVWSRNTYEVIDSENLAANMHNVYIQTVVVTGVVGLLLLLTCILKPVLTGMVYLFRNKVADDRLIFVIALLGGFCAINVVESDIVFSRNFMSTIFWILLGYVRFAVPAQERKLLK